MKLIQTSIALAVIAVAAAPLPASITTYVVDFGAPNHRAYVYRAGDFGLQSAPVVVAQPDTGEYSGFGYRNVRYQLGSAQLSFPKVGGYTLGEDGPSTAALIGSFFFSNPGREEVGSPVTFTITTASRADKVSISAIGSVQTAHHALLTVEGTHVIIDSSETFIPVVSQLTGKTTYEGRFATESGQGEANLGGFLVTIESSN